MPIGRYVASATLILAVIFELQFADAAETDDQVIARAVASKGLGEAMGRFIPLLLERSEAAPGFAVAVVEGDKTLYLDGFGYRDVENKLPFTTSTPFYIASSSKSMVGLTWALLAERGEVDLDMPITKFWPGLRFSGPIAASDVSIRDLLTHRSGLDNTPILFRTSYTGQQTHDILVSLLPLSQPIEAGRDFSYSNFGYVTSALILEAIFHESWKRVVDREVLSPLGMKSTTANPSTLDPDAIAKPYQWQGSFELLPQTKNDNTIHGAGGHFTTVEDLAIWLKAQVNKGMIGGVQILPQGAFTLAHEPQAAVDETFYRFVRTGYGLGWMIADFEGEKIIHHFGGFPGYRTHISFLPERRLGVAALVNASNSVAFEVPDVVAAFAYDFMTKKPQMEKIYQDELRRLVETRNEHLEIYAERREKAEARTHTMPESLTPYVGNYLSDALGSMVVTAENGELMARVGNLDANLVYIGNDSFDANFRVFNEEDGIRFHISPAGLADGLEYLEGEIWRRIDDEAIAGED